MTDKASGLSIEEQKVLEEKTFHGSAGYSSYLDNTLDGKGPAASIFEHVPIENNRESNADRRTGYMLELKDILSCEEGKTAFVASGKNNVFRV
jgi:hypothetical protein